MCEFDEIYDGIEEGRKMAVAAKLDKNKEMKPQDKQTEVEDKKKGPTKWEVKSYLQKAENQVKRGDRSCQMISTQTSSPDSSRHPLYPADKRERSSPSIDQLRSRIAKRATLSKN